MPTWAPRLLIALLLCLVCTQLTYNEIERTRALIRQLFPLAKLPVTNIKWIWFIVLVPWVALLGKPMQGISIRLRAALLLVIVAELWIAETGVSVFLLIVLFSLLGNLDLKWMVNPAEEDTKTKNYEKALFLAGAAFWVLANWGILSGKYIFGHDSFYWYGIFQYFAQWLQKGLVPVWNPFSHAGEMFFENFSQLSVIDPVHILGIFAGKLLGARDLFYLYELIVILKLIIMTAGVQWLLEDLTPGLKPYRYFLFFVMLLSSFTMNCYHQNGAYLTFGYTPYILLFFLRFLKTQSWPDALLLGYFTGISFQSIVFSYVVTFFILFAVLLAFSNWDIFRILSGNRIKMLAAAGLFLGISSPAWVLLFYKSAIYPYARHLFNRDGGAGFFLTNYQAFQNSYAAFGKLGDIWALGSLERVRPVFMGASIPTTQSELCMYVGFFPFLLGIAGIVWGRHELKKIFLILLFLTGVLFIGPSVYNPAYWILFHTVPSLRFLENTHEFVNYFLFIYFFFIGLGILAVAHSKICSPISGRYLLAVLFLLTLRDFRGYVDCIYKGRNLLGLHERGSVSWDFRPRPEYRPVERAKSILPFYGGARSFLKLSDAAYKLNFTSTVRGTPTAIDFPVNFDYAYLEIFPPTSLTYPTLYADILKSGVSQGLKATLLGVGLPPVEFVPNYDVLPAADIIDPLREREVGALLRTTVLLSDSDIPRARHAPAPLGSTVAIVESDPNHLKMRVNAGGDGVLLVRDGYNPSWVVRVNGTLRKVLRANYNSKAVILQRGVSEIDLRFEPTYYLWAWKIYILLSCGLLGFFLCRIPLHKPSPAHALD